MVGFLVHHHLFRDNAFQKYTYAGQKEATDPSASLKISFLLLPF